jgi:hypothetical protein
LQKSSITLKNPRRSTHALWGRTDGANLRYGLIATLALGGHWYKLWGL